MEYTQEDVFALYNFILKQKMNPTGLCITWLRVQMAVKAETQGGYEVPEVPGFIKMAKRYGNKSNGTGGRGTILDYVA